MLTFLETKIIKSRHNYNKIKKITNNFSPVIWLPVIGGIDTKHRNVLILRYWKVSIPGLSIVTGYQNVSIRDFGINSHH